MLRKIYHQINHQQNRKKRKGRKQIHIQGKIQLYVVFDVIVVVVIIEFIFVFVLKMEWYWLSSWYVLSVGLNCVFLQKNFIIFTFVFDVYCDYDQNQWNLLFLMLCQQLKIKYVQNNEKWLDCMLILVHGVECILCLCLDFLFLYCVSLLLCIILYTIRKVANYFI